MSYFNDSREAVEVLGGFFGLFPRFDALLREITGPLKATFHFVLKEPTAHLALDFSSTPLTLKIDPPEPTVLAITASADVFHDLLLGRMTAAWAVNRKRVLVRGSMAPLMQFMSLIAIAPILYMLYLEKIGRRDLIPTIPSDYPAAATPIITLPEPKGGFMYRLIIKLAYFLGYALGLAKSRALKKIDIFDLVEALTQGLKKGYRVRI